MRLLSIALLCAALASTSAAPATAQETTSPTIKIGMTVSSTGGFALPSQSGERGAEIWVRDVNARGGIALDGRKHRVELVKLDDRGDKQMVTKVYETLVLENKVDLLFGPYGSTLTSAATPVSERHGKFMSIWSAALDSIYDQGARNLVSTTQIASSLLGRPPVEHAASLGFKKMALVHVDEPVWASTADNVRRFAKEVGIEIVFEDKFPRGAKDYTVLLQKAKTSGAEIFYPAAYEVDQMTMIRQMKDQNVIFPYTFMFYASQPQFLALGSVSDYLFSQTLYGKAVNYSVTDGMDRAGFERRYRELYPEATYAADFQTALAYSNGVITEKLISRAGSLDPAKLKQVAIELSGTITVLTGEYRVTENGKQLGMLNVVQQNLKNGPEVVYPLVIKSAEPVVPTPGWAQR